jgi:4-amino-4-deoxy-L-arabinose transferase-like glycosyltransferase
MSSPARRTHGGGLQRGETFLERHHALLVAAVLAAGIVLRIALFSGYGLGDDPNFFISYYDIYRTGSWNAMRAYDFRFAFWVPVVAAMRLFGPGETAFIGFITACSILNLPLVYGLARQEWDRRAGLLAMALLAVFPLDVLCATLFVIDIPLATYCFGALWLYRAALRGAGARARAALTIAAGVALFAAYSTKQWAVLVGALFAAEAVRDVRGTWRQSALCAGTFLALVGAYFGWQWWRFGDPIYDIHLVRSVAIFEPHYWHHMIDYPTMLWLPNEYGTWFAGWYPHALVLLAIACVARTHRAGRWPAYFVVLLVLLVAAPSHRQNGRWVILVPHIFRYLCLISIPLCLGLTAYLREVFRWRPLVGALLVAALLTTGTAQAIALTRPTRDAFGEMRRAVAMLAQFPDERVWSDAGMTFRFSQLGPGADDESPRYVWLRSEEPVGRAREFASIREGIVVTGGGRLPWYGCHRCTANLADFPVPPSWTLVAELDAPRTAYRAEPLRIWRVSEATLTANQLLADVPGGWPRRMELLRALVDEARYPVAVAVGQRLALTVGPHHADEVFALTATACARAGKQHCARELLARRIEEAPSGAAARSAIAELVRSGSSYETVRLAREEIGRYRRRFPEEPDPGFPEVASGFAEAVALYHQNQPAAAEALFRSVMARADEPPALRRQAQYFLALSLFRAGRTAAAAQVAREYRDAHGEDEAWIELRYREADALRLSDPATARRLFEDVVARAPQSLWGREASARRAGLGPSPASP